MLSKLHLRLPRKQQQKKQLAFKQSMKTLNERLKKNEPALPQNMRLLRK